MFKGKLNAHRDDAITTATLEGNQQLLAEHSTLSDELFYNITPSLFVLSKIAIMTAVGAGSTYYDKKCGISSDRT